MKELSDAAWFLKQFFFFSLLVLAPLSSIAMEPALPLLCEPSSCISNGKKSAVLAGMLARQRIFEQLEKQKKTLNLNVSPRDARQENPSTILPAARLNRFKELLALSAQSSQSTQLCQEGIEFDSFNALSDTSREFQSVGSQTTEPCDATNVVPSLVLPALSLPLNHSSAPSSLQSADHDPFPSISSDLSLKTARSGSPSRPPSPADRHTETVLNGEDNEEGWQAPTTPKKKGLSDTRKKFPRLPRLAEFKPSQELHPSFVRKMRELGFLRRATTKQKEPNQDLSVGSHKKHRRHSPFTRPFSPSYKQKT